MVHRFFDQKIGVRKRNIEQKLNFSFINLNKQKGPTSSQTVDYLKKILNIEKAGHGGTLDPNVGGVLVCSLNKATKLIEFMLLGDKTYVGIMHLHNDIPEDEVIKSSSNFIGRIKQTPPRKSAVRRIERERDVYSLDILEISGRDVLFITKVEAGTYIRKLCHDWGKFLKVGGHMSHLVRVEAKGLKFENSVTLFDIKDNYTLWKEGKENKLNEILMDPEEVMKFPSVWIFNSAKKYILNGSNIAKPGIIMMDDEIKANEYVQIRDEGDNMIAIGIAKVGSDQLKKLEKGYVIITKKVIGDI